MDAVRNYLTPKTFGILANVCSILHVLCGVVFTGIAIALKEGEAEKFTCYVPPKSTLIYKTQVDKGCFLRYQQHYNAPLRFYIFVLLSTWFPIIIAVVYSLWVHHRVQQVDSNINGTQVDDEADNQEHNRTVCVFRLYFIHLAIRVLSGVLFTVLQHALLFPRSFDFKYDCSLPAAELPSKKNFTSVIRSNSTSVACENGSDKHTLWVITSVFNAVFALIILVEIIRLCRQFPICKYIVGRECDTEFINIYLLRKKYMAVETQLTSVTPNLQQCIAYYKSQVLQSPRSTCLITKSKTDFEELYINLLIHTERAAHKFSKDMERHEIYDVYVEVPGNSICLKDVKDLFYPNADTKNERPRKTLVVGRPGIGKTVLTEKILRDWAKGVDEFYIGKIAFYLKIRWFNVNNRNDVTLKSFLRIGTELSDEKFEKVYEEILKHPEKAILIFDGLDEFNSDFDFEDDLPPPNDPDICMFGILLFSKLISGRLLPEATVLVTSRPTANEFYSKFKFDRTVEIIGFTKERIEEYVTKFCQSHEREDHKYKIWNQIEFSSDILNSCYIPVNCFIVVTILFERLEDSRNESNGSPTTLTELYEAAVNHFNKKHCRKLDELSRKKTIEKLESLVFKAIETRQLIFDNESFDEHMKQSGLLNCLSNPYSQAQTQFCFIHLTIQEFLAARHVTKTFSPEEIEQFIFSHIKSSKWHLVLQFIAGLLGKEIKMFQQNCYKECVLAFAKSFEFIPEDGVYRAGENFTSLLVMRCLKEVEVEDIVKEACVTTAINDIIALDVGYSYDLPSSDWSAIFYVCKHMNNLKNIYLLDAVKSQESYQEALRLLEQRCVEKLWLGIPKSGCTGNVFKTLTKSKCSLNHEQCSKLVELAIDNHDLTDENLSSMCEFFRLGLAICLKELRLRCCKINSHEFITGLCEILDNKQCPELTCLNLRKNLIGDEGLTELCPAVTEQKLLKLTRLNIGCCSLTYKCLPSLCELLRSECCNLIDLNLSSNEGLNDEFLRILCEDALTNEHCKLERLDLSESNLTVDCLLVLCKTLTDEHCKLTFLSLYRNMITDAGVQILCEFALTNKDCKLVELDLGEGLLTDDCIPDLSKALEDEHCRLNKLNLWGNKFTNWGRCFISCILELEHCKAIGLDITFKPNWYDQGIAPI